jgi:hypothetical protein
VTALGHDRQCVRFRAALRSNRWVAFRLVEPDCQAAIQGPDRRGRIMRHGIPARPSSKRATRRLAKHNHDIIRLLGVDTVIGQGSRHRCGLARRVSQHAIGFIVFSGRSAPSSPASVGSRAWASNGSGVLRNGSDYFHKKDPVSAGAPGVLAESDTIVTAVVALAATALAIVLFTAERRLRTTLLRFANPSPPSG